MKKKGGKEEIKATVAVEKTNDERSVVDNQTVVSKFTGTKSVSKGGALSKHCLIGDCNRDRVSAGYWARHMRKYPGNDGKKEGEDYLRCTGPECAQCANGKYLYFPPILLYKPILSTYTFVQTYTIPLYFCTNLSFPPILSTYTFHLYFPPILSTFTFFLYFPPILSTYTFHLYFPPILSTYTFHLYFPPIL